MRPTAWQLYNNLELLISLYEAEGLPAAKARLHSIGLMMHEVRGVVRAKKRCEREMKTNLTYLYGKHSPKDKWGKLRYVKSIATLGKTAKAYQNYLDRAMPVIEARIAKLPELQSEAHLKNYPDNRYIKNVLSRNLQKRRFKFWDDQL